ncbi:electron transport complex subunit RsxG [Ferribacterium limneticum]|uniref:electron transport complex subunit RsxG n=1 Tax=Ferribacterium limneticum TaxID=76259 RepID=UPI001CFBD949|nr:electron transport complex subunit RsxG [Ferribacterium limneticum]UCV27285.1 electron transport complex subunit RsxG [Ferribacterium limneticum]UCV31202.1 electron transport complex subunit RsxG [Ferribacterium limneticum]
MSTAKEFTAAGMAVRTAAILFVFVIIFTGLLSGAYLWTKPAIEASAAEEKMKLVDEVLPRSEYDNALLEDTVTLPATAELTLTDPSQLYRARKDGKPVALVFEAVAPDGYAGKIRLIIAIRANGEVAGVRVTQHKETPGLGDYIEVKKDKNKARPWITQFNAMSLAQVADKDWKVRKDGGRLDYYAGATVTPRAVSKAVLKAVKWAEINRDRLFAEGAAQ